MQAPGQVQRGSGEGSEGSREGLGGLGAEPGQVKQGSGEGPGKGSGEGLGGFVQSQVRLNNVKQGSGEGSGEGSMKPWRKAKSGSTGFRRSSGEGRGGFGVKQGSGEGSGEGGAEPG